MKKPIGSIGSCVKVKETWKIKQRIGSNYDPPPQCNETFAPITGEWKKCLTGGFEMSVDWG